MQPNTHSKLAKMRQLLSLLPDNKFEFLDRVNNVLEVQLDKIWSKPPQQTPSPWEQVVQDVQIMLKIPVREYLEEQAVLDLHRHVLQNMAWLSDEGPFTLNHNADLRVAFFCYAICRAMRLKNVVETGVAYGVTTSFILQAMNENAEGKLVSIDLPPLGEKADKFVGALIPEILKRRWHLSRGVSARLLPGLLPNIGNIDLFIHDSLHTYNNIKHELSLITPFLSRPAIVIVDDIEGNPAFDEWINTARPAYAAAVAKIDRNGIFGIALFIDQ